MISPAMPTSRTRRARLSAALAATAVLVLAGACGKSSGNDTTPVNEAQAVATTAGGAKAAPATTGRDDTDTTRKRSTSTTGDDGPATTRRLSTSTTAKKSTTVPSIKASPDNEKFCTTFLEVVMSFSQQPDPSALDSVLPTLKAGFQKATDAAPDAIKADWVTLNNAVQKAQTFSDLSGLDSSELKAASDRISEWTKTNCGFDPDKVG